MKAKASDTTKAPLSGPLLDAIAAIQKDYGNGSNMRMVDRVGAVYRGGTPRRLAAARMSARS